MVIFGGGFRQMFLSLQREVEQILLDLQYQGFWSYSNVQPLRTNTGLMHSNLSHDEHNAVAEFCKMDFEC